MPGTWQPLLNQPVFNTSTMFLLTDGRVMVQEEGTQYWHALTPDSSGSYVNGTWSTLASMNIWRRYYASGMLKDGRVFICGGEQSGAGGDTNQGEIYDPVTDTWTPITVPPWAQVGDAACCVLPDGRVLIGDINSTACLIYDPLTDSWAAAANKSIKSNEETWILQADNTIVAPQCWPPYESEKYLISADTWKKEGGVQVTLVDPVMHEIGPGMLLYNGKTIFFGAADSAGHGKTALYTPPALPTDTGKWAAGPDIPVVGRQAIVCNDCPASLMPNGKVLVSAANFENNNWGSPVLFFEYDPATNTLAAAPAAPNNATSPYGDPRLYWSRMMLLPSGQVLFSPSSKDVRCYTPDGGPQEAWRPTIVAVTPHGTCCHTDYYLLQGTQLNGLSQANIFGDDVYSATNYPLVQLTDTATHQVYYCRTYEFSTMGVATGASLQSTRFSVAGIPDGTYNLRVIANGISSHPVSFCYNRRQKVGCCEVKQNCCCGGCRCCCERIDEPHPEIDALKTQVKLLQNSVQRLSALTVSTEVPGAGKESAKAGRGGREEPPPQATKK